MSNSITTGNCNKSRPLNNRSKPKRHITVQTQMQQYTLFDDSKDTTNNYKNYGQNLELSKSNNNFTDAKEVSDSNFGNETLDLTFDNSLTTLGSKNNTNDNEIDLLSSFNLFKNENYSDPDKILLSNFISWINDNNIDIEKDKNSIISIFKTTQFFNKKEYVLYDKVNKMNYIIIPSKYEEFCKNPTLNDSTTNNNINEQEASSPF